MPRQPDLDAGLRDVEAPVRRYLRHGCREPRASIRPFCRSSRAVAEVPRGVLQEDREREAGGDREQEAPPPVDDA